MRGNKQAMLSMLSASLCIALLPLAGCDKKQGDNAAASALQPPQTQATPAYVPPTADQLYQLVGPIALFPDKLVAQVLAASSYPDQVTAANNWLAQNKQLQGSRLQDAVNRQPWDVSVKGLTLFPNVLDQMARNIPWTSALGDAYVNDPADVMNAIQIMRQRAAHSGHLKSNKQQRIAVTPHADEAPPNGYVAAPEGPIVYYGPEVIPPPPQTIVIEPAEPDVVYVPDYNPSVVYGQPLPIYPGYYYEPPRPYIRPDDIVATDVITFGLGVILGAAINDHDWGWRSWDVHWGGRRHDDHDDWHRPAVVYKNNTYVSNSTTIVNRVTNNYNTVTNNRFEPSIANNPALTNGVRPNQTGGNAGTVNAIARPGFTQQTTPNVTVARPAPGTGPQAGIAPPNVNNLRRPTGDQNAAPVASGAPPVRPALPLPDFNHMTRPNFNKVMPQANNPAVAPTPNQLARPGFIRPAPDRPQPNVQSRPAAAPPTQPVQPAPPGHTENAKLIPNRVQQNAQNRFAAQSSPRELERPPVNLRQHPFGNNSGNGDNVQRPNINRPAVPEMARPQPLPPPQYGQNQPNGGQQMRPEINRPPPIAAPAHVNRPEPPPQARPEPRQPPQARPEPRPPVAPPIQVQAPPPHQPAQPHEQPHHDDGKPHPDKRDEHK